MFLLLIAVVFILILYFWFVSPQRYWKRNNVPFETPFPLLGNMFRTIIAREHFFDAIPRFYYKFSNERYFGLFHLLDAVIVLRDPELIKQVTVKDFETFPEHRAFSSEDVDPLWNKNLFAIIGLEKWRRLRSTLSPTFTGSKMRMMFKLMNECAHNLNEHYIQSDGPIKLDMKDTFRRYATDIIASAAFGVNVNSLKDRKNEFFEMGQDAANFGGFFSFILISLFPALAKAMNVTIFSKAVSSFFRKLVKDNIRMREEKGIVRPDMIHLLMEARKGKQKIENIKEIEDSGFAVVEESDLTNKEPNLDTEITDEDITAQALIFFVAGFDTVSTLMCFTALELAINPDIQEKLFQEVNERYQKYGQKVTYEELMRMKYLDMVISETLRKWPPAIFLDRKSTKSYAFPPAKAGGEPFILPKGSLFWVPMSAIHRDPQYYPNPDKFDPERFSDENKANIKPFTYMPFGLGPRNCIGSRFALLEAKIVFYHIIANFELTPAKEMNLPVKLKGKQFQLEPIGGFMLELRKRG